MSDDPKKWERPLRPPSPLFFNQKERDLVKQINDEIRERVIGQKVVYYPIDTELTRYHSVYGEAIEKSFLAPIVVSAHVLWEGEVEQSEDAFQVDRKAKITVNFLKRRLIEDQNLFVRIGDFIAWGDRFFEIVALEEPKQLYGQSDQSFEIAAKCIQSRKGRFDAT